MEFRTAEVDGRSKDIVSYDDFDWEPIVTTILEEEKTKGEDLHRMMESETQEDDKQEDPPTRLAYLCGWEVSKPCPEIVMDATLLLAAFVVNVLAR